MLLDNVRLTLCVPQHQVYWLMFSLSSQDSLKVSKETNQRRLLVLFSIFTKIYYSSSRSRLGPLSIASHKNDLDRQIKDQQEGDLLFYYYYYYYNAQNNSIPFSTRLLACGPQNARNLFGTIQQKSPFSTFCTLKNSSLYRCEL